MSPRQWLKLVAPLLASITGLVSLRLLGPNLIDQHQLSEWMRPLGRWGPVVFILFLAVRPLTLLPGQVFTAVGGIVFGTRAATLYALLGSFLGSAVTFAVGRSLGSRALERLTGQQYLAIRETARRHGFWFALIMCVNPLMPTDVALAAAAASGARFRPTVLGMMLGTLPGTLVTAMFGSALGQGKPIATALGAGGMVLSLVLGLFFARRVMKEVGTELPESAPTPLLPAAPASRIGVAPNPAA